MTTLNPLFQTKSLIFVLPPNFRRITQPPSQDQQNCNQTVLILNLQIKINKMVKKVSITTLVFRDYP